MDLDDWRSRINDLDEQILSLLNQRGHAALQIGELKRQQDSPYFVPEREAQLLDRLLSLNRGPLGPDAVRAVWREILSASLALEHPLDLGDRLLGGPAFCLLLQNTATDPRTSVVGAGPGGWVRASDAVRPGRWA